MNTNLINSISTMMAEKKFSGTVLVKKDQVVWTELGYGYANRSEQLINNGSTRYGIA
jgi:hypothetical protein